MSVSEFIEQLRDLPHDISHISPPDLDESSASEELSLALKDLDIAGSVEGRHTVLQAAALIPSAEHWEDAAWTWAVHDEWIEGGNESVEKWIGEGLRDGKFDKKKWVERALVDYTKGTRAKFAVIQWGLVDLVPFLDVLAEEFLKPQNRIAICTMLLAVCVEQHYEPGTPASSTIMYRIVNHPILQCILKSLMYDTGNHLFPKCIRLLLAIIPYAPLTLNPQVPFLMIITGRAISWRDRKFVDAGDAQHDAVTRTPLPVSDANWQVAKSANEEPIESTIATYTNRCVTLWLVAMYGAWPSNVLAFVRDPIPYLRLKSISSIYDVEWESVYPPGILAQRIEPLLKDFALHPSLVKFTSAAELQDDKRWEKNDPSEWLARAQMIAHMEKTAGGMFGFMDSRETVPSAEEIADMILPSGVQSGTATPGGMGMWSEEVTDIERLRRENESLRLEAKLTDRVRKQFLYHIGRLHGYTLKFNTEESEMNSFVNRLKEQDKTIKSLTADLSVHRAEASAAQQKHVKWQAQLRDKNTQLREERKTVSGEMDKLKGDLAEMERVSKQQKDELAVVKNERFKLQNQLMELQPKINRIGDYETRMKQFTEMQLVWDNDVQRVKEAESKLEALKGRFWQLEQMLRACEKEKKEQRLHIRRLETTVALRGESRPSSPHPGRTQQQPRPDSTYYLGIAEDAKKRAEQAEKENRELRAELEQLRDQANGVSEKLRGDRTFIWADEEKAFPI